jgi:hypothetical protein
MKAFIIMFNRLTWPLKLIEKLEKVGCEIILIDNGSTYPPLLKWYKKCKYKVHYLPNTYGHRSLWQSNIISQYKDRYYIVTDHDLDITDVPDDFIEVMMKGLCEDVPKAGLSLMIEDLPINNYTNEVRLYEDGWWKTSKDKNGFYYSDIDTTLAVYDSKYLTEERFCRAVRTPDPYTARHLPWYNTPDNLTEEEIYYKDNVAIHVHWVSRFKGIWGLIKKNT